jgi:hypothetical protein
LQARAEPEHFAPQRPGRVQQEDHQRALLQLSTQSHERRRGALGGVAGKIQRITSRIKQNGKVPRIADESLHRLMLIKTNPHVNFAAGQTQVSQPTGRGFLLLEFLRMHEKHEPGSRFDRHDRSAPAE